MGGGAAQRSVWRGNEPKKTGARSARARTRGQNPLVLHILWGDVILSTVSSVDMHGVSLILSPPSPVGRARLIYLHHQQRGHAGYIPLHRQQLIRAECIPFHLCQFSLNAGPDWMLRYRTKMPGRRHRPRCRCPAMLVSPLTPMPPQLMLIFSISSQYGKIQ